MHLQLHFGSQITSCIQWMEMINHKGTLGLFWALFIILAAVGYIRWKNRGHNGGSHGSVVERRSRFWAPGHGSLSPVTTFKLCRSWSFFKLHTSLHNTYWHSLALLFHNLLTSHSQYHDAYLLLSIRYSGCNTLLTACSNYLFFHCVCNNCIAVILG